MGWMAPCTPNLLRQPDVQRITSLPRSTLYLLMKQGRFPRPVRIGPRLVAWRATDVTAWMESLPVTGNKENV